MVAACHCLGHAPVHHLVSEPVVHTYRNLVVDATYSNQTFKHIHTPSWMLSYVYASKSYQVIVNGVTGSIAGERPWSWVKIALLVLLGLIILATWASLDS